MDKVRGGFSRDELLEAGAAQVFTSLGKLQAALDSVAEIVRLQHDREASGPSHVVAQASAPATAPPCARTLCPG